MAAHQAPPSLGFSRQERWSGLPFPALGTYILTLPLVTLIYTRTIGKLVMRVGGECGEEQEASGSREGGPRSEEGVDHELTPSCVSPDFLHNLA